MRAVEFKGGLGDIICSAYITDSYVSLDKLGREEEAVVTIISHNRGVRAIFDAHPNRERIRLNDLEYTEPWGPVERRRSGVPDPGPVNGRGTAPVRFYPFPSDLEFIKRVRQPYIVFSLSSSETVNDTRTIPVALAERAAVAAMSAGFSVVTIGKNYEPWSNWGGHRWAGNHLEIRLKPRDRIFDAVDILTVPGALRLLEGAHASFCAFSGMMWGSWLSGCRTFVCHPSGNAQIDRMLREDVIDGRRFVPQGLSTFEAFSLVNFEKFLSGK